MHSDDVPPAAYEIVGKLWVKGAPGFAEAIAHAFEQRLRPRCLCRRNPEGQGIEMYVASLMGGYIIKRMPNTGSQHASNCPSYEPPADLSGLGQLLGSAIVENPATGETALKLDFPMTKLLGRATQPTAATASNSVASLGQKLTLRSLLHYLWDQAELTHWKPGFFGRRSWTTVRRHLLRAAEYKVARGHPLLASLYIPEMFSVEQREAINRRRLQQWAHAHPTHGAPQQLMLMIAEVKEVVPARFGYKLVIKHMPDRAFVVDETLYRRLCRCFERELALWAAADGLHMLAIATFKLDESGIPSIVEMSIVPVTPQWLPIEDQFDRLLVEELVRDERSFIKCLRYDLQASMVIPSANLTDCGESPQVLVIARPANDGADFSSALQQMSVLDEPPPWIWNTSSEVMPVLPRKRSANPGVPELRSAQGNRHPPVESTRAITG